MSSEVCPFCGKTYKRLKSHLPHCKAAATSKTPPSRKDVTANQTATSLQTAATFSKTAAKGKKSSSVITGPHTDTSKKVTALSSEPKRPSTPANTPSSSPPMSPSITSPPPLTKKKQKLTDQIKAATLCLSPSPPLATTISKPKKKSLRALIEAAKSEQVTKGSLEGSVTDPTPSARTAARTKTKTEPGKDSALLPADTKPKYAPKKPSEAKKVSNSSTRSQARESLDSEGEIHDLFVNNLVLKSGNGRQATITIQDVKAALGRAKVPCQSSRASILSQADATDNPCSKIRLDTGLGPVSRPTDNQKDVATSTSPQHTELKSDKKKAPKTKQAALIPLQDVPEPTFPATPLLPANVSSEVWQVTPLPVSLNEGLKMGHHMTGLRTKLAPVSEFSSLFCPLAPQSLPVRAEMAEKPEVRKQKTAENPTEGALTHRSLGQVRLRELPEWLACKTPSNPKHIVEMLQRGWQWYYGRYIDVKKGGVGGLGMLLAGYCVLGYIWSYPHIKLDRWRKYH